MIKAKFQFKEQISELGFSEIVVTDKSIQDEGNVKAFIEKIGELGLYYHKSKTEVVFIPFHMIKSISYELNPTS